MRRLIALLFISILAAGVTPCSDDEYADTHKIIQDLNGDGINDVVHVERHWNFEEGHSYPIIVRLGASDGGFSEPRRLASIDSQTGGPELSLKDVDGDDRPDITYLLALDADPTRRIAILWMNLGDGSFRQVPGFKEVK